MAPFAFAFFAMGSWVLVERSAARVAIIGAASRGGDNQANRLTSDSVAAFADALVGRFARVDEGASSVSVARFRWNGLRKDRISKDE